MLFKRWRRPKSAAELANEAEVEKLAEEATWGELDNEERVIARGSRWGLARPIGFFNSAGVKMQDDKPYTEEPPPSDQKV